MTSKVQARLTAVSSREIRNIDRAAMARFGIPSLVLMENAGRAVAAEVIKLFKRGRGKHVSIVCGSGNNGGDGFVAARYLHNADIPVRVFLIGKPAKLKHDALINFKILKNIGVTILSMGTITAGFKKGIHHSSVVVDAIFGFGLNRTIHEPYFSVIQFINRAEKKVIAVDVPSGLDATTGNIFGICVKADTTITLSVSKTGFYLNKGPHYAGRIKVADIGIPSVLLRRK